VVLLGFGAVKGEGAIPSRGCMRAADLSFYSR